MTGLNNGGDSEGPVSTCFSVRPQKASPSFMPLLRCMSRRSTNRTYSLRARLPFDGVEARLMPKLVLVNGCRVQPATTHRRSKPTLPGLGAGSSSEQHVHVSAPCRSRTCAGFQPSPRFDSMSRTRRQRRAHRRRPVLSRSCHLLHADKHLECTRPFASRGYSPP